jgi:hypothetical protein
LLEISEVTFQNFIFLSQLAYFAFSLQINSLAFLEILMFLEAC